MGNVTAAIELFEEYILIQGYADQTSIYPGQTVTLHVSTDAPAFRVEFYRQGATLDLQMTSDWLAGLNVSSHPSDGDWGLNWTSDGKVIPGWPGYDFFIPPDQAPGVLIAMLVEGDGQGNERGNTPPLDRATADARTAKALFVVKNPAPGTCTSILYKLPLLMYQAYNSEGGWSLYQHPPVTLRRPGGGTGGTPWDYPLFSDPNDDSSPRQTYGHWDAPFIAWLEGNGYPVDYCTDLDIDADNSGNMLGAYRLLLSVGHDEYWTTRMRDHVERFIGNGGNVAFFSGNTCWWQITFDNPTTIRRTNYWYEPNPGPHRPENSLTGVSYRNAGGNWNADRRPSVGYTIQHSDHWIFNGTGLADGDTFGQNQQLVGYECDGANFDRTQAQPFKPRGDDGTPLDFIILGVGDVTSFTNKGPGDPEEANGNKAATMGIRSGAGMVFTAATVDWPRVVGIDGEPTTVSITVNVLRGLSGFEAVNVSQITGQQLAGPVTSWQTLDGPYTVEHLAGIDAAGDLFVFYWSPRADWQAVNVSQITGQQLAGPVTSWQTLDGPYTVEHLAGIDAAGDLFRFSWSPGRDWCTLNITFFTNRTVVSAPRSWQVANGARSVQHLAASDGNNQLWVFYWY
jgi:hypothetical protein